MPKKRWLETLDWAARFDFVGNLVGHFFDWKTWVAAAAGGAVTFLWAAIKGRDPFDVWLAAVVVAAALAVIANATISIFQQAAKRKKEVPPRSSSATLVDDKSRELSGLTNALLERAGSYSFRLPLAPNDPFIKQYNELKNSVHPIWTDRPTNQLRRDFLQYCGIVGRPVENTRDHQADMAELHRIGRKLIAALKGEEFNALISLKDAAAKLYGALRGTDLGSQMEWKPNVTPDEILAWAATHIVEYLPVEVKRPPSRQWELLPESEKKRLMVCDGAVGLKYFDDDEPTYIEPRVQADDVEALVADYKQRAKSL